MTWTELRPLHGVVEKNPLASALAVSLTVHLALFGGWRMGDRLGWWKQQATWLLNWHRKPKDPSLLRLANSQKAHEVQERQIPLEFVEVDPSLASTEPPKETKYYGVHNAKAANPDVTLDATVPKMEGKQDKAMRTEDVPRPKPFPLQPAAPPEETKQNTPAEPKPKGGDTPGDLALAKPAETKRPSDAEIGSGTAAKRARPRTLEQVRTERMLAGRQMKQDGGVRLRGRVVPNVRASQFGAYDAALIAAVQQRWYDLLDSANFTQRSGKVVLEFRLTYDGRITDMKMTDSDVGELLSLLCQRAVLDPAPFARWPDDMRRMVGVNYREVTFTFYYN